MRKIKIFNFLTIFGCALQRKIPTLSILQTELQRFFRKNNKYINFEVLISEASPDPDEF